MVIFGVFWGKLMRRVFIWAAIDGRDGDTKVKLTKTAATETLHGTKKDAAKLGRGANEGETRETRGDERGSREAPPHIMG